MKFFFVGNSESEIHHVENDKSHRTHHFKLLGQSAEFTAEEAEHHIRGGAALLSEEEFNSCGFTAVEVDQSVKAKGSYAKPGSRVNPPAEFLAKLRKAWTLHSLNHQRLHAEQLTKEAAKPVDLEITND
jgi:hypothetical protein